MESIANADEPKHGIGIETIEIPAGLTAERLDKAIEAVYEWEAADLSACELVIKIYNITNPPAS